MCAYIMLWLLIFKFKGEGKHFSWLLSPSWFISKSCTFNHAFLMNGCCQFSFHRHTSAVTWRVVIPETWSEIPQGVSNYFRWGLRVSWNSLTKLILIHFNLQNCSPWRTLIKKKISENQMSHSGVLQMEKQTKILDIKIDSQLHFPCFCTHCM